MVVYTESLTGSLRNESLTLKAISTVCRSCLSNEIRVECDYLWTDSRFIYNGKFRLACAMAAKAASVAMPAKPVLE